MYVYTLGNIECSAKYANRCTYCASCEKYLKLFCYPVFFSPHIWKVKLLHYIIEQETADNLAVPRSGQVLDHSPAATQITSLVWRVGCDAFTLILMYLLAAIVLAPGGSSAVHIHTQTVHRTTQLTRLVGMLSGIRTQSGQTKINNELTA